MFSHLNFTSFIFSFIFGQKLRQRGENLRNFNSFHVAEVVKKSAQLHHHTVPYVLCHHDSVPYEHRKNCTM